jgi:hypothetical protein
VGQLHGLFGLQRIRVVAGDKVDVLADPKLGGEGHVLHHHADATARFEEKR